jgi:hypothetical protein
MKTMKHLLCNRLSDHIIWLEFRNDYPRNNWLSNSCLELAHLAVPVVEKVLDNENSSEREVSALIELLARIRETGCLVLDLSVNPEHIINEAVERLQALANECLGENSIKIANDITAPNVAAA